MKTLLASLAVAGVILAVQPGAQAAPRLDGVTTDQSVATEMSAQRRHRRHRRVVRTYTYPTYYGYYGPTTYYRPYARPAPVWFGIGGWW